MGNSIYVAQIIIAVALTAAILMQSKGTGLGSVFGGDNSVFRTRRGAEKGLFNLTVVLGIAFCLISIVNVAVTHSVL